MLGDWGYPCTQAELQFPSQDLTLFYLGTVIHGKIMYF